MTIEVDKNKTNKKELAGKNAPERFDIIWNLDRFADLNANEDDEIRKGSLV